MKQHIKSFSFKFFELLPSSIGDYLYHTVQNFFDKMSTENRIKKAASSYETTTTIFKEKNIELKDKTILDIGSGWLPMMPYFFVFKNKAKKVLTYDIYEHFQKKPILKLNKEFSRMYDCNIIANNKYGLPDSIEYFPKIDLVTIPLPKVDILFSRYVLSHMKTEDVIKLHRKIKNELPKNTHIIHFISPSDLRQYVNKKLSMQDFLRFSKEEWEKIPTKYSYHNRLRLPQFVEIFKDLGFEIIHLTYDFPKEGSKEYKLYKEIIVHQDYKKYSDEELTAGNIVIVLKT